MCDCYTAQCVGCDAGIDVHIADLCVSRSRVRAWCPACAADAKPAPLKPYVVGHHTFRDEGHVFIVEQVKDEPAPYGIRCN